MNSVSKDVIDKIIKIVKEGGGEVFETEGFINFFGVRNSVTNDSFNDSLYIYWKEGGDFKCVTTNGFTTKPGKKVILNSDGKQNKDGAAILKEGWQKDIWNIGLHKGSYKALRSTSGVTQPTVVTRDNTQYGSRGSNYELRVFQDRTYSGYFGINFHRSGRPSGQNVNGWSAGCQVFKEQNDFLEMLDMAEYASNKGQKTFSYFLTNNKVFNGESAVGDSSSVSGSVPYDFSQSQFAGQIGSKSSESQYTNNVSGLGDSTSGGDSSSSSSNSSSSSSSFGLDNIFGKVFPEDDNNRYIEMSSEDIAVIQYTEPILKVEELNISKKYLATMGIQPDKISYFIPVVFINDFMIPQTNITNFCLDYSSFMPQVMVEFVDMTNEMLSTNIPKPGSYIKVYVGGNGDENYYKPIRQDFVITNIIKTNKTCGEYQNYPNSGNPIKYKITGVLNVPLGFRKMSWCSSKINARQAMFNISNIIGLGFATNYNTNSDVDVMRWVNTQNKSYTDFIREITQHSCYSPYTFFTSFIDQYYVLNYVECRRLLSHAGKKTDLPQMIYNCILPEMIDKTDKPNEELNSGEQKVSYYFLSNSSEFKGWTNYIEEYYELSDGYAALTDGYKKTLTYSDKCGFLNLSSKNYKFLLTPIDNIKRDEEKKIVSLPETVTQDTYIPLNLRQTTNSAYVDNQNLYDNPTVAESIIDIGEVDTSNNFPLYFYASVQNDFQMKNLKKCGLSVRLQNYNPSITKFSRIWVDIYDMHRNSNTQIQKNNDIDKMQDSKVKEYLKSKNDNIISFKEDMEGNTENQTYNRSLSGWYIVTEMKIVYNTVKDFKGNTSKKLQTQLILNRIEYKPTYYSEYEIARNAIEKYKNDNLAENIMCGGDTM
jgi:uncharacterized protein (UPF0147 family)